ncbi:hypothetical protein JQ609_33325 [Bradyrhizobium sp. AUGA SZCCT0169]|uniref:hypothetical protein n=1 Tax=Bradyrhizobium sp. AUGA SZCCT0169 TaxID=2807663 RepID=UPI001BAADE48|nr:hypothetical protein [Bradyrhizobium sp. AUGA SZCCT0169]MBR1251783.1 hypothetical protein [Bradyrhizobium sp. AUGA SZCCT0169]
MTADPPSATGSAERRIEGATDAIRSMSQDLADEVAPQPSLIDRVSSLTRAATATDIVIATRIEVVDTEIEMTAPIEVGTARAEAATIEATMMTEEATTMIALGGT